MWPWQGKPKGLPHQHGRYQSMWFYRGAMYVPRIVRTVAHGYFLEQEPVKEMPPTREAVREILEAAARRPDIVPEPKPLPYSPLPRVVGAQSLEEFHRNAVGIGIYDYIGGDWEIGATVWPMNATKVDVVERSRVSAVGFPENATDTIVGIIERWPMWRQGS